MCINNVKQDTQTLLNYATDNQGSSIIGQWDISWGARLMDLGYVTETKPNMMVCPVQKPGTYSNSAMTYAVCSFTASSTTTHYGWWGDTAQLMRVDKVQKAWEQPWVVDSIITEGLGFASEGYQTNYIQPANNKDVHLRHLKQVTIGFVDGSARACNLMYIINTLNCNPNSINVTPPKL